MHYLHLRDGLPSIGGQSPSVLAFPHWIRGQAPSVLACPHWIPGCHPRDAWAPPASCLPRWHLQLPPRRPSLHHCPRCALPDIAAPHRFARSRGESPGRILAPSPWNVKKLTPRARPLALICPGAKRGVRNAAPFYPQATGAPTGLRRLSRIKSMTVKSVDAFGHGAGV